MFILLVISSIPVFAVYLWFRLAKYPFSLYWFLFALLAGAAAFFPALILQNFLNVSITAGGRFPAPRWELFYHVFFRVAFTEELSRLLTLFVLFWINSRVTSTGAGQPLSWSSVKKGTATGLVVGLGFAILESAVYGASDTGVLLSRAITAAPLHAACGSRVGAAAVMLRTNPIQAFFRLLTATLIHGIYNFMIVMPGFPSIAAVLIALTTLASSILTISGSWLHEEKSQNS